MTKYLSLLLLILFEICFSQVKINNKSTANADTKYFLGTWVFIEKNYKEDSVTKIYPLQKCIKNYTLLFEKENNNLFLTKNYVTGKDCSIKSSSGKIPITITESNFYYLDLDIKKVEYYTKLTKNRFSIRYNDILNGKIREINDIYERK
ncbi:hypothetical protein SAMN05421664_2875 [Chryseobacterium soldanellicola]|uniref:Lipocalin-like domain-containing protein n=1 Tax=Chryseobacterium soldanellicola TaxID=311333 RepID=A0A1H1EBD4_9FLAO|nr:hypothetical protein [Chryseobacterium soldanellicola]SDQ86055.1 hypothetical protein SAMN05421664_2875 [Chryseobacterium soldanellicola]